MKFARFEHHRLVPIESARLGHPSARAKYILPYAISPYDAGWKFCTRCKTFLQCEDDFCPTKCGTRLRVSAAIPLEPEEVAYAKFRAMFEDVERPPGQSSILNY